ncbi:MAG: hypothetical protein KGO96_07205 [Elusimicrobia bacterium]|nr:hypothetical protein [Elusimicrobiota bacterium]
MTLRDRARIILHKLGMVDSKLLKEIELAFDKLVAEERSLMNDHFHSTVSTISNLDECARLEKVHADELAKRMEAEVKEKADQDLKEAREAAIKEIVHH